MAKKSFLFALLFFALINSAWAFDFYAVCSTGQTLYYNITDANNHYVEVTYPTIGSYPYQGYQEPTGAVIIPSSVTYSSINYTVTSIGEKAFFNCTGITGVTLPNSLQNLGELSFYGCRHTSIIIPPTVATIHENVFQGCIYLNTVYYNAINCTFIYSNGQYYNNPFDGSFTLFIGEGVQSIPAYLFYDCSLLSGTLSLPSSLLSIGDYSFYQCSNITGCLTIPSAVTSIGQKAFQGCYGITSVAFNATNCQCSYYQFGVIANDHITSITIGENVQVIPDYFFGYCSGITELTIPGSVTTIGHHAFFSCSGITSLVIPNNVATIDSQAFAGCTGLVSVVLGNNLSVLNGGGGLSGLNNLQSVVFNSTCCYDNTSSPLLFSGCPNITNIQIGNNVQRLPEGFLWGSTINSPIILPESLTTIGEWAFRQSHLVDTLTIPQLVANIGDYAFAFMNGLSKMKSLPTTPPTCGEWAFKHNYGTANPPLEVPCGCVDDYSNAYGWNQFQFISESPGCTHQISVLANPSNGGSVSGGGTYNSGTNCTVTATPNSNYSFVNWTENGTPVSSNASYSFVVNDDRTLTANFQYQQPSTYTINASADPANGGTISGAGTYTQGQTCTLIASANSGFAFLNWTENGNVVSTNANYSFTVTGNRTLVAHFVANPTNYTITVSANPSNGGTVTGGGTYQQGQQCTVIATANSNYTFIKWTENGTQVSTNPTYSFTVNSNRTLVAHFQNQPSQYTITLSANPTNGGTVSGGGTYSQGQTCTVIANANPSYSFVNWTENGAQVSTNSTYSFTVTGNRTLVANFSYSPTGYVINATAEPSYGGLVSGAGTYNQGQTCTLIATPNPNYDFANWTEGGNVVLTSPTYSFTVNGNRTLVAHFESQVYTISVSANPTDGGTVYGGGDYSAGITCHLIAVPNNNYSFLNWTENGVAVSSDSDYSFVVMGNRDLVANFINYDGLNEVKDAVSIYPNPTNNKVFIKGNYLKRIEVFDAMGVLIVSEGLSDRYSEIDLQHLSSGMYCLKVFTEEGYVSKLIIKD